MYVIYNKKYIGGREEERNERRNRIVIICSKKMSINIGIRLSFSRKQTIREFAYLVTLILPFCSCDLDLDPMNLIYVLDLDILKKYLHTKNEVSRI